MTGVKSWQAPDEQSAREDDMIAMLEQLDRDLQALAIEVAQAYVDGNRLLQRMQTVLRPDLLRNAAHLQVRLEGLRDQIRVLQQLAQYLWSAVLKDRPPAEKAGTQRFSALLQPDAQAT